MKITSIIEIENFVFENNSFLALQSKSQKSNIQILKITVDEIYVKAQSNVKLFRLSLDSLPMYLDSEGRLDECIKNIESWADVYAFKNFTYFYEWYSQQIIRS